MCFETSFYAIFNLQSIFISELMVLTKLPQVENNINQINYYQDILTKLTLKCRNQNEILAQKKFKLVVNHIFSIRVCNLCHYWEYNYK